MKKHYITLLIFFFCHDSFACSGGMSVDFVQGIPGGYYLIANEPDYISKIVNKQLNRSDWVYIGEGYSVNAPEIAENSEIVPVTISTSEDSEGFPAGKLVIIVEKHVSVLDTKNRNIDIPHRNRQLPLNFEIRTISAVAPMRVATYEFQQTTKSVSTRLNLNDADKARVLGLFVPADDSKPVQVIRQEEMIRIHRCDSVIYVDGPMPKGAGSGFYYF